MEENKNSRTLIYVISVLVFVLLGLITYFFFFRADENTNNSTNSNSTTPIISPTASRTSTVATSPTTISTPTSPISSPTPTVLSTPTGTLAAPIQVRVMYSVSDDPNDANDPNSSSNLGYVEFRILRTNRSDSENFVMEKTIEGPSEADKTGYFWYSPIKFIGDSNCEGRDFTINKNSETNTITVKLCKQVETAGIGTDARIQSVIRGGMQQFLSDSSTKKVIIFDKNDNCFGDQSGLNKCKI